MERIFENDQDFNDFFPRSTCFYSRNFDKVIYKGVFNAHSIAKVNLYKLHGAFNVLNSGDDLNMIGSSPLKGTKKEFRGIPSGFYKFVFNTEIVDGLKTDFIETIKGLSFMSGIQAESTLWTGNTFKLAMKGYEQSYSRFCHQKFSELVPESELIFLVGYGGRDPDINRTLRRALPLNLFIDFKPSKTIVYAKDNQEGKYDSFVNHDSEKPLEIYLEELKF